MGETVEGAVEHVLLQLQPRHLPQEPPALQSRLQLLQRLPGEPVRVPGLPGKIAEAHRRRDLPPIFIVPHQKAEEGGLSPTVASGEAQLPIGVDLKAQVLKYIVITAVIGKGKM